MGNELIDIFAELEIGIEEFSRIFSLTLLSELQESRALVAQIDEQRWRDLFSLHSPLTDANLAIINLGCISPEDTSEHAKECREEQRKLSQLVNKLYKEDVINNVFLIAIYSTIHLDKRYNQTLKRIIEHKPNSIEEINGFFEAFYIGDYVKNIRGDLQKLKLTNLSSLFEQLIVNLNNLADLFENGERINFTEFELLLQKYYKLSQQYNSLSTRKEKLQKIIYFHDVFSINRDYVSVPQEMGLQELLIILKIKQDILAEFWQSIEKRIKPITAAGEDNPHYDSEIMFYYARILFLRQQLDITYYTQVEYYLNLYLNSGNNSANKIVACGMLYLLQIYIPKPQDKHRTDDELSKQLVNTALKLENQCIEHSYGFGYVISILYHVNHILQLRMQSKSLLADEIKAEIECKCLAAAKRGFNFRALIDKILATNNLLNCLFDFQIITHLYLIDPVISKQYAYILLALICQELREYQLAIQFLETQRESKFTDIRIQQAIVCILGMNNRNESVSLLQGLVRILEGEIVAYQIKDPENNERQIRNIQSNIMPSVARILTGIKDKLSLVDFLEIVKQNLAVITQARNNQRLIQNTVKQILDIINREYFIFSVNPDALPTGLNIKIAELKVFAPIVFQAYQDIARPFAGIMQYRYEQIQQKTQLNSRYSMFVGKTLLPPKPEPPSIDTLEYC